MAKTNVYRWSFIDRTTVSIINFGVNIALARMLSPNDFGLLAMIAIFTAVAWDLSNCGLSDGLIHKLKPTETDYSTVFVYNTSMGLILGTAFFLCAPMIASFFGHSELIEIMRVLGVCFFFQTMSLVQEARLRKLLNYKNICLVHIAATVTANTLAIIAAAKGYGYRALVCSQILLSFFNFFFYAISTKWFPKIRFSVKAFKEFFGYGVHLMLSYFTTLVGANINTSILGRFYSTASLSGIYNQGAKLAMVPFKVTESTFNWPFFSVASNEADPERRQSLSKGMFNTLAGVNALIVMYILAIASPAIELLYGREWLGAIPVLRILALSEFLIGLRCYFQTLCKVHGRTARIRNMAFLELGFQLALLAVFYKSGILWIAWTQVAAVATATVIYAWFCSRYIGVSKRHLAAMFIKIIWLPGVAAIAAYASGFAVMSMSAFVQCLVITLVFAATGIIVGEIFKPAAYMSLRGTIMRRLSRRGA